MREVLLEVLKDIVIFHGLKDDELSFLLDFFDIRRYEEQEYIYKENDMGKEMFVILEGKIEILKKGKYGVLHSLVNLGKNELFGEMSFIDMQKRSATVRAKIPTIVATLSNMDLYGIYKLRIDIYVKILMNIARELSRRLRKTDIEMLEFFPEDNFREH